MGWEDAAEFWWLKSKSDRRAPELSFSYGTKGKENFEEIIFEESLRSHQTKISAPDTRPGVLGSSN